MVCCMHKRRPVSGRSERQTMSGVIRSNWKKRRKQLIKSTHKRNNPRKRGHGRCREEEKHVLLWGWWGLSVTGCLHWQVQHGRCPSLLLVSFITELTASINGHPDWQIKPSADESIRGPAPRINTGDLSCYKPRRARDMWNHRRFGCTHVCVCAHTHLGYVNFCQC